MTAGQGHRSLTKVPGARIVLIILPVWILYILRVDERVEACRKTDDGVNEACELRKSQR